jgi:hypothetical protein
MNPKLIAFAAILACAASANAASLQIQALGSITNPSPGNGYNLSLADGSSLVPAASLVQYGYFTISDAAVTAAFTDYLNSGNVTFLNNIRTAFQQWGTNTSMNFDGRMGRTITNGPVGSFAGQKVSVWVFNTATTNTATQMGIFTSPEWLFPSTDDASQVANFAKSYAFNTNVNLGVNGLFALVGSEDADSFNLASLTPVPEPSVLGLVGLGGISVLKRRRKA